MNQQSLAKPIIFHPSYEKAEEGEQDTIRDLIKTLQSISDVTVKDHGHAFRSVHAKSHGLLKATLTILPNLPTELKQGIFAKEKSYEALIRLSTSPGDFLDDDVSTPRAFALKVMGVDGERLQGEPSATTQDFLMVVDPVFLNKDAKGFLSGLKLIAKTTDKAHWLKKIFSAFLRRLETLIERLGGKSATIRGMGGFPKTNILGESFFTQVPILYGPYIAKVKARPVSPELKQLLNTPISDQPNALRQSVNDYFANNSGQWELMVQLCRDLNTMPIEDASIEWPEDKSPYIPVAILDVKSQIAWDENTTPVIEDRLAFNPWNGITEHRPLGSVMRARRAVYEHSSTFRRKFNGCPMAEVRSSLEL